MTTKAISTIPNLSVSQLIRVAGFVDDLIKFFDDSSSVSALPISSVLPFLDVIQVDLKQIISDIDSKTV